MVEHGNRSIVPFIPRSRPKSVKILEMRKITCFEIESMHNLKSQHHDGELIENSYKLKDIIDKVLHCSVIGTQSNLCMLSAWYSKTVSLLNYLLRTDFSSIFALLTK